MVNVYHHLATKVVHSVNPKTSQDSNVSKRNATLENQSFQATVDVHHELDDPFMETQDAAYVLLNMLVTPCDSD